MNLDGDVQVETGFLRKQMEKLRAEFLKKEPTAPPGRAFLAGYLAALDLAIAVVEAQREWRD